MTESFIGVNLWTALFTLLNFLAVLYAMKHFLYGPIMKMVQERQKEIDDLYTDAGQAKQQAQQLQAEYQQKLTNAQETSDRLVKEAMARGQAREEEIIRNANAQASAILEKASADIAQEKKKALNDAKNEISGLALAIAGKVVERELTDKDQEALIDRFIEGLGDQV